MHQTCNVTTGKKISGPVEPHMEGMDTLPAMLAYAKKIAEIQVPIKVYDLQVFTVRIDGSRILVDLSFS